MTAHALPISMPMSSFEAFLYAAIGEDHNGVVLTVLSLLARQNVDPWDQAAALSLLPTETARTQLAAMLASVRGYASAEQRIETAGRLIPLLPKQTPAGVTAPEMMRQFFTGDGSVEAGRFTMVALFLASMILGLWVFGGTSREVAKAGIDENPPQAASGEANIESPREEP